MYSDSDAAALYDLLNVWGPSDDFYLSLVMQARSVLDVGCGTGVLLHRARLAGHFGVLCGVDPDLPSLTRARRYPDIEWVEGTAAALDRVGQFELAVMASHAFQVFITDSELHRSLGAIARSLVLGGRFAFETRNPSARAWERWNPANAEDVVDHNGVALRVTHEVESVIGDVVTFSETTGTPAGTSLRLDRTSLRFIDVDSLGDALRVAGFTIEAQYGSWDRGPLTADSPEIITIARL